MAKESKKGRKARKARPGSGVTSPLSKFVRGLISAEAYFSLIRVKK